MHCNLPHSGKFSVRPKNANSPRCGILLGSRSELSCRSWEATILLSLSSHDGNDYFTKEFCVMEAFITWITIKICRVFFGSYYVSKHFDSESVLSFMSSPAKKNSKQTDKLMPAKHLPMVEVIISRSRCCQTTMGAIEYTGVTDMTTITTVSTHRSIS